MTYIISKKCHNKIATFYHNVAKKYKHTYSRALMHKNIDTAYSDMRRIENGLIRRIPTIPRWQNKGCYMANTKKWYYLYKISGETITVVDACHSQNMKESIKQKSNTVILKESQLKRIIRESIKKILNII